MKNIFLITGLILMLTVTSFGQNSLFEDKAGEGAFKINNNRISLNAAEEAIKVDYFSGRTVRASVVSYSLNGPAPNTTLTGHRLLRHDTVPDPSGTLVGRLVFEPEGGLLWGFNLNAKAANGTSSILSGDEINFRGTSGIYCSIYPTFSNKLDYFNLSASITSGRVDLLDTADILAGSYKRSFLGYRFEAAYNRYGSYKMSTIIFGISASYTASDNANDLSRREFTNTSTIISSPSNSVTQESKISGFIQEEYDPELNLINFNLDWGIYPHRSFQDRVLFAAHIRSSIRDDSNMIINSGLGAYLTKDGAPSNILGGINFMIQDTFGTEDDSAINKRIAINVVAGFRF